jgi:hypothetical protein
MITFTEAEAIAKKYLADLRIVTGSSLQLTKNQEEPFGWVFFYQSKEYMETGNLSSMLAGNAPFIIDNKTGEIHILGTAHPADAYIKKYEHNHI